MKYRLGIQLQGLRGVLSAAGVMGGDVHMETRDKRAGRAGGGAGGGRTTLVGYPRWA